LEADEIEKGFQAARTKQQQYQKAKTAKMEAEKEAQREVKEKERNGKKEAMEEKKLAFDNFTKEDTTLKTDIAKLKEELVGLDG